MNEPTTSKFDIKDIVKTSLILFAITTAIALILSALYMATKDTITERLNKEKLEKIQAIFGEVDAIEDIGFQLYEPLNEVSLVRREGVAQGFIVDVSTKGFGGDMRLLVGVNIGNTLRGVRILSANETGGIGTKVENESFLKQFEGLVTGITVGGTTNKIDAITGATISSKAVTKGVNDALEATLTIDISAYVHTSDAEYDLTGAQSTASEPTAAAPAETAAAETEITQPAQESTEP